MAGERRVTTRAERSGLIGTSILLLALFVVGSPSTVSGQTFEEFPVPTDESGLWGIAAGPDGALWFTEWAGGLIGRITTAGQFTEFTVLTAGSGPTAIAAGPDGAPWFTEHGGKIGRITLAGLPPAPVDRLVPVLSPREGRTRIVSPN